MNNFFSLCFAALLLGVSTQAFAGQRGGQHGMYGMGKFGHHGAMHGGRYIGQQFSGGYRGGGFRYAGGYGGGFSYGGGGYGAGYSDGGSYGYNDIIVTGGGDLPEHIYVYPQAQYMAYSHRHQRNCCHCQ